MHETYYVGSYWGPRQESAEACARRAAQCFKELALVDPLFARWFKQAKSRKEALKRPLEMDLVRLEDYFQRKVLRDDTGGPMEDMGFNFALWNGGNGDEDVGLTFTCGGYWENVTNLCLLSPPHTGPHAERLLTAQTSTAVLRALARAWEPDSGVVISDAHRKAMKSQHVEGAPYVGWVTYLASHLGTLPPMPDAVRVEPVEDKGSILILTPERFSASNPEHVALATHVRELLEQAGLLHPPKPGASK
jgi:hypothetical protein